MIRVIRHAHLILASRIVLVLFAMVLVLFAMPALATAQPTVPPPPTPLTLDQAMQYAAEYYPSVRVAIAQVNASIANVDIARTAYLPRLDSLWQSNRATANNIFGQLLPQGVIPSLSGPVLPSSSARSVWGSAAGALFSWEPFDFGLHRAEVVGAEAAVTQAHANEALTRLGVQNAVAQAFLNVVAAQRFVSAAQADLDRRNVLLRSAQVLVDNQLRPGADASRANAERAAAQTRLSQAQQALVSAQVTLTRGLGLPSGGSITLAGDSLLARLPPGDITPSAATAHPLAQARQAAIAQARASEQALARTDVPRLFVESSVFARGSGANASGLFDGGIDGLGLERANWAAGVQVIFPNLFDFSAVRARKAVAAATERANSALYDEALLTITTEQQSAAALLQATRAIAANTPVELAAAQQSEMQARARYDAGLTSVIEVADAQSLLAQAEVQDQLARVEVWRALLAEAAAQGDLASFINLLHQP
jgi:outer membrane protein TolC